MDERESAQARQRQGSSAVGPPARHGQSRRSEPTAEEIVKAVRATRETIYVERYGTPSGSEDSDD